MADWTDLIKQNNEASSPMTQANIDLLKAQTTGANLTNEGTALSLQFRKQLAASQFAGQSPGQAPPNAPGDATPNAAVTASPQAGDFQLDSTAARQHAFQSFSPIPDVWTPDEANMRTQAMLSGIPGAADAVKAQHDARIAAMNGTRSKAAQQEYNNLYGVITAPDGRALDALSLVEPQAAARFKAAGLDDDAVRQHASSLAGIAHSVGQLPVEYRKDGVAVDKTTQQEIPGYDQAVGLSAENRADLVKAASGIVDVPNSDGSTSKVPQWKADGASSLEAWVSKAGQIATAHGVSGASAAAAVTAAPRPAPIPTQETPQAKVDTAAKVAAPTDPVLRGALADRDFKVPTSAVTAGTSATPGALEQQKATVAARTDLLKDSSEATNNAAQALAYAKAAKALLDSKGAPMTGLPGAVKNALSHWTGGAIDSSNYQEAAKYLGNLALQGAKVNYGSHMTGGEVGMQKDELSANVHMNPDAIDSILTRNIRDAQYVLDTAKRTRPFLATGGDPQQFSEWNQKYYPRDKVVNGGTVSPEKQSDKAPAAEKAPAASHPNDGAAAMSKSGKPMVFKDGHWQYK